MKLIIPQELMDLNTYIDNERSNRYGAAEIKRNMTDICALYAKKMQPITERVKMIFTWYCPNQKKDPDNICFARKFVLDGMVAAGVLENDGWKQIQGFEDHFEVDKEKPRVEIEMQGV